MPRTYEVSYGPGHVRGTRKQVSRWLDDLAWQWFLEEDHLQDVALDEAWARLPPSERAAWLAQGAEARSDAPGLPEHATGEKAARSWFGSTATREWQALVRAPLRRPAVPWIVRADTDKAHRCPVCGDCGGLNDEMAQFGHPGRSPWHVYQCTRCGQRLACWPAPLLPELETGRRFFWERVPRCLRRALWYHTQHVQDLPWEIRHNGWGYALAVALPLAARRDWRWIRADLRQARDYLPRPRGHAARAQARASEEEGEGGT